MVSGHTHTHTRTRTHTHTYTHTYTHIHAHTQTHIHICMKMISGKQVRWSVRTCIKNHKKHPIYYFFFNKTRT